MTAAVRLLPLGVRVWTSTGQFTYLGGVVHRSGSSEADVNRRLGLAAGAIASHSKGVWLCRYLCRRTKVQVFRVLVLPILLYSCETWALTSSLNRRLNSFGTVSLCRILGYRWSDFVSNDQLLRETGIRQYVSIGCVSLVMWPVSVSLTLLIRFPSSRTLVSRADKEEGHGPAGGARWIWTAER